MEVWSGARFVQRCQAQTGATDAERTQQETVVSVRQKQQNRRYDTTDDGGDIVNDATKLLWFCDRCQAAIERAADTPKTLGMACPQCARITTDEHGHIVSLDLHTMKPATLFFDEAPKPFCGCAECLNEHSILASAALEALENFDPSQPDDA